MLSMFPNRVIKLAKNVEEFVEMRRDVTSVSNSDVHIHFTVLPAQQASRLEQQSLRKKKRKVLHNYRIPPTRTLPEYGFADNYTSLKLAQAGNKLWIPADARESILGEAVFNVSLANGSCKETFQVHFVDCETVPGSSVGWHTSCQ